MPEMIIINSNAKHVIVLKALGMTNLRIFPGHNEVVKDGLERYFENSAAKGYKDVFTFPEMADLDGNEREEAKRARKKNNELNKAQRVIKTQNEKLAKSGDTIAAQKKEMANQKRKITNQGKTIEDQAQQIADLTAAVKELKELQEGKK